MNIYEQLNKINDNESLSEKYNVKNAKELKKLKENTTMYSRYEDNEDHTFVYRIGQMMDNSLFDADYSIDSPDDSSSTRENFIYLLKELIQGSRSIDFPVVIRGGYENTNDPSWEVTVSSIDDLKAFRRDLQLGRYPEK